MADIGSTLREARMRARIDITEVESATKIRAKYLRALENEEWDLLPGAVYTKSFLRTYGDYLGLDSRMLTDEFKHRYERPSDHELHPIASLGHERERRTQPRRRLPPWLPVLIVAAVVVGMLYGVGLLSHNGTSNPPAAKHSQAHHPVKRHHKVRAPAGPPRREKVTLRLVPTGAVYVCLVNGAGRKLVNAQDFNAGQHIPVQQGNHLLLTLGTNAINVFVEGHAFSVAPSARPIRLLITPKGVSHIPLSQTPKCP